MKTSITLLVLTLSFFTSFSFAQREVYKREKPEPVNEADMLAVLIKEGEIALSNEVLFKYDSTDFAEESAENQLKIVAIVMNHPKLEEDYFLIEGHTCDLGTDSYNDALSKGRAERVRKYLIEQDVTEGRLSSIGYGESRPLAESKIEDKDDPETKEKKRQTNRRVIIRKLKK